MSFFDELKRRKVFRVAAVYGATAFAVLSAADLLVEALNAPGWLLTVTAIVAIVGFPVALVVAWAYELSVDGVKRTEEAPTGDKTENELTGAVALFGPRTIALVSALLLVGIGMSAGWFLRADTSRTSNAAESEAGGPPSTTSPSIAVLPFVNSSSDPDNEYFSDGIAEDLITALGRIPGIEVAARTSTWQFKGANLPAPQIADSIAVSSVLAGSVRRNGEEVRITVELVSGDDGRPLWSNRYDVTVDDLFATQDQISRSIADALQVRLTAGAAAPIEVQSASPEAYDHYLLGRYSLALRDSTSMLAAIREFEAAIAVDSSFALAWSGLAEAWTLRVIYGPDGSATELFETAMSGTDRAIELDANLAPPHAVRGFLYQLAGRPLDAERSLLTARELDPEYTPALQWLAQVYADLGREDEAVELIEEALRREPFSRGVTAAANATYAGLDQHELALSYARRIIELDGSPVGAMTAVFSLLALDRVDEAREQMLDFVEGVPMPDEIRSQALDDVHQVFEAIQRYRDTGETGPPPPVTLRVDPRGMVFYSSSTGREDDFLDTLEALVDEDSIVAFQLWLRDKVYASAGDVRTPAQEDRFRSLRERFTSRFASDAVPR